MFTRWEFIETTERFIVGSLLLPVFAKIAALGIRQIESARSEKAHFRRHSGLKYLFVEQEEYASAPLESMAA